MLMHSQKSHVYLIEVELGPLFKYACICSILNSPSMFAELPAW